MEFYKIISVAFEVKKSEVTLRLIQKEPILNFRLQCNENLNADVRSTDSDRSTTNGVCEIF
jgi:hypothetical protein